MAERRLVAVGRKRPEYHTQYWTYATRDDAWQPQSDPAASSEPDPSDIRKRQIEDALAADDLL